MSRQLRNPLLCTLVLTLAAGSGFAAGRGEQLFEFEAGDLPVFRGAEAAWRVRVDTELLTQAPRRLRLETPDGLEFDARRIGFERRGPGSLTWRGRLADSRDSRAILSMEDGVLSGWIQTPFGQYEVWPLADGGSAVLRMSDESPGECAARQAPLGAAPALELDAPRADAAPRVANDSPGSIAVLALFTTEARDAAGGVAQIKSKIRLMIDLANEAYANSRMSARLKLAYVGLSPFRELGRLGDNLEPFRQDPRVQTLRDTHSADLVALIQSRDPEFCGVAYIMHQVGQAFSPYAYSVTAFRCLSTLGHEIGHNMGMEHDPANGSPAAHALFPWAFGHYVSNDWRTVMSYQNPCGNCSRIPYFSNPNAFYEGQRTGIAGERDNARVGNRTARDIANFRLSGVLLEDDFESGSLTAWGLNRGAMKLLQPGLEGDYLLEIPMTGIASRRYLMHEVGPPGKGLDVEFLFNANSVELGGAEVDILVLFGNGVAHTKLVLRQEGSSRRVSLVTKGNDGAYIEVASTPVRKTRSEMLRVEWRGATDPRVADGSVRLVKNGGGRGVVRDFANDRWSVRQVRLGIPNGAAGTSGAGSVYVDNYAANVPLDPQ